MGVYNNNQPPKHTAPKKRRFRRLAAITPGQGASQPKQQAVKDEIIDEDEGAHTQASPSALGESHAKPSQAKQARQAKQANNLLLAKKKTARIHARCHRRMQALLRRHRQRDTLKFWN